MGKVSIDGDFVAPLHPRTLGSRLDVLDGEGPSFGHLRIGLSLSILFWHSFGLTYGLEWTQALRLWPFKPLLASLLPMFFALSGFLIMGSALRIASLKTFITFRVLRILPALASEISLSALVLGPLMTAYPLSIYFSSRDLPAYFGSLVGRVSYVLPGLFLTNPAPEVVNGALWTVGPEILCYTMVSFLILIGVFRRVWPMFAVAMFYLAACMFTDAWDSAVIREILPTKTLILAFLCGNLLYLGRYHVPFDGRLGIAVGFATLGLLSCVQYDQSLRAFMYPAAAGCAYMVAVIGLMQLPRLPFFHRGDYSYGIYIYGYPIQQTITHFLPEHRSWSINFAIALPLTLVFAVLSWHYVEKPVLNLRKIILKKSTPEHSKKATPAIAQSRNWLLGAALLAYGIFVADAARVFPLRPIARTILGKTTVQDAAPRPQF